MNRHEESSGSTVSNTHKEDEDMSVTVDETRVAGLPYQETRSLLTLRGEPLEAVGVVVDGDFKLNWEDASTYAAVTKTTLHRWREAGKIESRRYPPYRDAFTSLAALQDFLRGRG